VEELAARFARVWTWARRWMTGGNPEGDKIVNSSHSRIPQYDDPSRDVLDSLRDRIATQQIPPGSPLREQAIADEFGVPRTRVRDVFTMLEAKGLIQRIPNRGAIVARLDVVQLSDIYDVREVLEGACARLAAERSPEGSWDTLVEMFDEPMQAHVDAEDFDGFVEGYDRFREQVTTAARNAILTDMLGGIYERTQVAIRRIIILPGRAEVGLVEHRRVLSALVEGDGVRAEELRRASMRSAKEYLLRFQSFVV
jgi:DNA-binding GntR family transcriptional regulator